MSDAGEFSLWELFRSELSTHLDTIDSGLASESKPDEEAVRELYRAAHSIKGAARVISVEPAVRISSALEERFGAVRDGALPWDRLPKEVMQSACRELRRLGALSEDEIPFWCESVRTSAESLANEMAASMRSSAGSGVSEEGSKPKKPAPRKSRKAVVPLPSSSSAESSPMSSADAAGFDLSELFRMEAEGYLAELSAGLVALESNPADRGTLDGLMRAAHSIKGGARVVGLDSVVAIAHVLEDCFVAAQEGRIRLGSAEIDELLTAVDLLVRMSHLKGAELESFRKANESAILEAVDQLAKLGTESLVETLEARAPAPEVVLPKPERPTTTVSSVPAADGARSAPVREVRIQSEALDRLMALAGESLVESRWLDAFYDGLVALKREQATTAEALEEMLAEADELEEAEKAKLIALEGRLNTGLQALVARIAELDEFSRRSTNLSSRLYREAIASRMRPFSDGTKTIPRLVRDTARELGKSVRLEIRGDATEVDRDILDRLEAPLGHILRNALDHGLESPEERRHLGKPEEGKLVVEARHEAGGLVVLISDDGSGIALPKLRSKIVDRALASREMVDKMSEPELLEFLFLPGFSTASAVTSISGRGVGLDVVQTMVRAVGGLVRIESKEGEGTTFQLLLPLTRSVVRTLLVEVAGEPWAIPLARIDRTVRFERSSIELVEGRQYFRLDGQAIGLVLAQQALGLEAPSPSSEICSVVVVSDQLARYGLVIDRFLGEQDLVVRPLDARLGKVEDVESVAILPDGSPVLVIDVADLVRSVEVLLSGGRLRRVGAGSAEATEKERPRKRILVVDDSITVREVQRKLLENNGFEVEVAVDGVDGWNAVRTSRYDLVISDVDMPRMTGIEFVSQIKKDPKLQSIPVMIVSYKDREEDRQRGLQAGANYYLTKGSFHDETMLTAVIDLIGKANE